MAGDERESIFILGEGGTVFQMDLPLPEAIADRLAKGHIRQVNEDGSAFEGDAVAPPPTEAPALSANKPEWIAWAVATGMKPDDAEALTKQDLIDKTGGLKLPA